MCSTTTQNSDVTISLNQGKMVTYNLKQNTAKTGKTKSRSYSLKGKLMNTELGQGAEGFLIAK